MINTIFYFADTQLEYLDNYAQGSVKPHTICFAKDTKTIWRDGQRFSGMLQNEVDDEIHQFTDEAFNNLNDGVQNLETGLNNAVQAAAEEKVRLNGLISALDDEISGVAANLTNTAAAIRNEVRNGELYTSEGWDPKVNAYLKTVGLWDYGTGDTQHVTKWSTLRQSVGDVSSEVNRVETKADGYNNTLQSKINQEVTDRGEAVTTLSNTFAKSTKDLLDVIEWMYSGLHSGAAQDMSYAEIIAAGKNGASSAISDLRTSIETTSDGKYVAQSSLTSSVDSAISGIVNDVTGKYANTSVFSLIDTNSDNIAAINTFIGPDVAQSTLAAKLNGAEAGAVATVKNDLATMHILSKSGNNYTADVYTKSYIDGAISGLVSENEFTAASIIAKVNGASSSAKINADHISIDANHQLDLSAQNIAVNADDINIDANHQLDLTSQVIILRADKVSFQNSAGNLTTPAIWIDSNNGTLHAVNGDFSGKIVAGEGSIGGFVIGTHLIKSSNNKIILNDDGTATIGGLSITSSETSFTGKITAQSGSITGDISIGPANGLHMLITPNDKEVMIGSSISYLLSKGLQFYNGSAYKGGIQFIDNDVTLYVGDDCNVKVGSEGFWIINPGSTYNYMDTHINNLCAWMEWKYDNNVFLRLGVAEGKIYGLASDKSDFRTYSEAMPGELYLDNGFLKIK